MAFNPFIFDVEVYTAKTDKLDENVYPIRHA